MKAFLTVLFLACLIVSCGNGYPPDVTETLNMAGTNRTELVKVLDHYAQDSDSLKYEAAVFLIGNMKDHGYATYRWHDTSDNEITFNVLDYENYDSLIAYLETIEDEHGELDYERDTMIYDRDIVTADYLIENIDYAFKAWREKPWAKNISFEQFKQYILPYRGSNEPLEPWREFFMNKYADLEQKMTDPSDPIEAACLINDDIKTFFTFDSRFYLHPTDQGAREMLETGMGRCEDITNLTIYAMRANGLVITSDYTPHWANHDNNHAWNAIADRDGKIIQFMGAESNPGQYNLEYKYAKVYRKMFSENKDNLSFIPHKQEKVPGWLASKSAIDVTHEYPNTAELSLTIKTDVPDSVDIAYLCVYNDGNWRAVDWAKIDDSTLTFESVGLDILYATGFYLDKEIVPFGDPFIYERKGVKRLLTELDYKIALRLASANPSSYKEPIEKLAKSRLESGTEYELQYWVDNEWKSFGTQTATKKPMFFREVPANCLYRLIKVDGNEDERPFVTSDGETIRWL